MITPEQASPYHVSILAKYRFHGFDPVVTGFPQTCGCRAARARPWQSECRPPVELDASGATEPLAQGRQQLERPGVFAAQPVGRREAVDQDRGAAIVATWAQAMEHEQPRRPPGEREIGVRHLQCPQVALIVHRRRLAVSLGLEVDGVHDRIIARIIV